MLTTAKREEDAEMPVVVAAEGDWVGSETAGAGGSAAVVLVREGLEGVEEMGAGSLLEGAAAWVVGRLPARGRRCGSHRRLFGCRRHPAAGVSLYLNWDRRCLPLRICCYLRAADAGATER